MKKPVICLLSALVLLQPLAIASQDSAPQIQSALQTVGQRVLSAEQAKQASALAAHLILKDNFVDNFLKKAQFTPPAGVAKAWQFYPDYRKVLVAASMAESALPHKGADQMLAMLAYALSRRGDPIHHEPILATLRAGQHYGPPGPILFADLPAALSSSQILSKEHIQAIKAISGFLESGVLGTPQSIMVHYAGLTFDEAFAILESSASTETALQAAIATLPEDRRSLALTAMVTDAVRVNSALRHEDSLAALLPPDRPSGRPPDDYGPGPGFNPPSGGSGGGGGSSSSGNHPVSNVEVEGAFDELVRKSYPDVKSKSYEEMKINDGGFGGIVFGNKVNRAPGTPPIKLLSFTSGGSELGALKVVFENGAEATLPNVTLEEAWSAHQLIFARVATQKLWSPGEGIGLTGLEYSCRAGFLDTTRIHFTKAADHERVVLNPVLKDSNLGWSAIATDVRARYPAVLATGIAAQMRKQELNSAASSDIRRLVLRTFAGVPDLGWKVMDVPLEMSVDNSSIVFTRTDPDGKFPVGLRRIAYLEMFPKNDELAKSFPDRFYRLLPLLSSSFPEYRKINHFAAVLALARLTRIDGGLFPEPKGTRKTSPTPEYIVYQDGKIAADPNPFCEPYSAESLQKAIDRLYR